MHGTVIIMFFKRATMEYIPLYWQREHYYSNTARNIMYRESRCLAGEPKHFPFAIVRGAFLKKWQLRWPPRRNITSEYPCAAAILAATSSGFLPVRTSCWKKLFSGDVITKNHKLYVNLTILAGFFAITQSKIIALTFRKMEKMRLDELYIYVDKN